MESNEKKIKLKLPLVVEGRYDKSTLSGFISGTVITTGGFSIFNNKEKQALIRRIAKDGVIVMTDSDGGGRQIRAFLSGIIPKDKIHHLFIPEIEGKEGRKARPSRSGRLGVEGMSREVLERLLLPFADGGEAVSRGREITKTDLYLDGLSGRDNSAERRAALCSLCELPSDMTANALLEALNLLYGYDEYKKLVSQVFCI
ncbi:MAG: DUF4093 domain-containing protein [Clostridia bacterium]|nr:DUF4093 domain-containing protein [Clostridia bacterium]